MVMEVVILSKFLNAQDFTKKLNSVALVRERTAACRRS
jgi:hypothetical protein